MQRSATKLCVHVRPDIPHKYRISEMFAELALRCASLENGLYLCADRFFFRSSSCFCSLIFPLGSVGYTSFLSAS